MKSLDLNFICQTLNLPLPSANQTVKRIVTDSRDIQPGDVFFALAGERFDAHDFVADVLAKGATAAVVSREDCAALNGALTVSYGEQQNTSRVKRKSIIPIIAPL